MPSLSCFALQVKADERTGSYREQSANLNQYTQANRIPSELKESMQEHLRLHFDTQDASDEQVGGARGRAGGVCAREWVWVRVRVWAACTPAL